MKKWSVFIYLAGDNNLSEDMVTALKGLLNLNLNDRINLYVCYDSIYPTVKTAYYDFSRQPGDNTERTLATVKAGEIGGDIYGDELIMTDVLKEFFKKCFAGEEAKADDYILILSGHGDGFREKTLLYDENPSGPATLEKINEALEEIRTEHLGGEKFAILGLDSCCMAMLEIAYQFKNDAGILVSSQSYVPNSGWAYEPMLRELVEDGSLEAEDYASTMVSEFNRANYEYSVGGRAVDLSAIRLNENCIETLNDSVYRLTERLEPKLDDKYPAVQCIPQTKNLHAASHSLLNDGMVTTSTAALAAADNAAVNAVTGSDPISEQVLKLIFSSHWTAQTFLEDQVVDIKDFCWCLKQQCEFQQEEITRIGGASRSEYAARLSEELDLIRQSCENVINAVDQCVINSCYTGFDFQFARGISLYLPWSFLGYCVGMRTYKNLKFFKSGAGKYWETFLNKYMKITMREPRLAEEAAKFTPPINKFTPPINKFTPPINKFTPPINKFTPPINKGLLGEHKNYFGRKKNVPVITDEK